MQSSDFENPAFGRVIADFVSKVQYGKVRIGEILPFLLQFSTNPLLLSISTNPHDQSLHLKLSQFMDASGFSKKFAPLYIAMMQASFSVLNNEYSYNPQYIQVDIKTPKAQPPVEITPTTARLLTDTLRAEYSASSMEITPNTAPAISKNVKISKETISYIANCITELDNTILIGNRMTGRFVVPIVQQLQVEN